MSLCFIEEKSMLIAGYKSGKLASWTQDELTFTQGALISYHDDQINKLMVYKNNYLLSCSSDLTFKCLDTNTNSEVLNEKLKYVFFL